MKIVKEYDGGPIFYVTLTADETRRRLAKKFGTSIAEVKRAFVGPDLHELQGELEEELVAGLRADAAAGKVAVSGGLPK